MVAERALSVRQTEALVRRLQASGERVDANRKQEIDPDTLRLESELTDRIGAPVAISYNKKGRGQLVIRYSNLDELDGILAHLV
jgi:ParB family chromosome partitioning protein